MPKFSRRINPQGFRRQRINGNMVLKRDDKAILIEDCEYMVGGKLVKFRAGEALQGCISHVKNKDIGGFDLTIIYRNGKRLTKKGIDVDFLLSNQDID